MIGSPIHNKITQHVLSRPNFFVYLKMLTVIKDSCHAIMDNVVQSIQINCTLSTYMVVRFMSDKLIRRVVTWRVLIACRNAHRDNQI